MRHFIHKGSLINIDITTVDYFVESLDSYRIFQIAHIFTQKYTFSLTQQNLSQEISVIE